MLADVAQPKQQLRLFVQSHLQIERQRCFGTGESVAGHARQGEQADVEIAHDEGGADRERHELAGAGAAVGPAAVGGAVVVLDARLGLRDDTNHRR